MNKATGMTRIIKATGYSLKGLKQAWQHEAAFRQETILTIVGVIIACLLPVTLVEKLLLIGSVVLIMLLSWLTAPLKRLSIVLASSITNYPVGRKISGRRLFLLPSC